MNIHPGRFATRFVIFAALLLPWGMAHSAEKEISGVLQKGLFEEEANHNLDVAMQSYQAVISRFDADRKLAAIAVFRLGECYRKQGKTAEAKQQYERIIRDFSDQTGLVKSSQASLGPQTTVAKETPSLLAAAEDAEIQRLKDFLKDSPDLINGDKGKDGMTPLQEAVSRNQLRVATWLLDQKADINFSNGKGTALHIAAADGNRSMTEFLLSHGADPNARGPKGKTPLHAAAGKGFKSICELLIKNKAGVDARDDERNTPLIATSNAEIAELLLANKADINARQKDGWTALILSAFWGEVDKAKLLLDHGAEVNNPEGGLPLFWAVNQGHKNIVELLLKHKADPNLEEGGETPLAVALKRKDTSVAELLISYGADVNKGNGKKSSVFNASNSEDYSRLEFLLSHGADPNPNTPEFFPLFDSVARNQKKSVELLLKYGADPNRRSSDGQTPLEIVYDKPELVDLLRSYGASEFASAPGQIVVARKGRPSILVFTKDRQGYNRHTLLDVLAHSGGFSFPDFSRIVIHRTLPGGNKESAAIPVNLLNSKGAFDLSKDVPLNFGDVIELPERVHSLGETDNSYVVEKIKPILDLRKRTVTVKTGPKAKEITLDSPSLNDAVLGDVPQSARRVTVDRSEPDGRKELFDFLPSTADFSRVEVTRIDPITKQKVHYTADLRWPTEEISGGRRVRVLRRPTDVGSVNYDDVWLLDGDCIEIPEKN